MKKIIGLLVFGVFCLIFISCNSDMGNNPREGKIFFQPLNSSVPKSQALNSAQRTPPDVSGDNIEFLVTKLLLVRDDDSTNGWIIGAFDKGGLVYCPIQTTE